MAIIRTNQTSTYILVIHRRTCTNCIHLPCKLRNVALGWEIIFFLWRSVTTVNACQSISMWYCVPVKVCILVKLTAQAFDSATIDFLCKAL